MFVSLTNLVSEETPLETIILPNAANFCYIRKVEEYSRYISLQNVLNEFIKVLHIIDSRTSFVGNDMSRDGLCDTTILLMDKP